MVFTILTAKISDNRSLQNRTFLWVFQLRKLNCLSFSNATASKSITILKLLATKLSVGNFKIVVLCFSLVTLNILMLFLLPKLLGNSIVGLFVVDRFRLIMTQDIASKRSTCTSNVTVTVYLLRNR